jgi:integrase
MQYARSKNTVKAYEHSWQKFALWCAESGRAPLPAAPATVLDFLTWRIEQGRYRLSTIRSEMFGIQFQHARNLLENPVDKSVKDLIRSAARKLREQPRGKRALTPAQLQRICEALKKDNSPIAKRDLATTLLGFAAGWRRGELVSLALTDVWFEENRMIVQLGASKTDQAGTLGRRVSIPQGQRAATCPVRAMRAWLTVRGDWQGPLFCRCNRTGDLRKGKGIGGETVNLRLKSNLSALGENAAASGAHSLRAGMITSAAENGADVTLIMQRTGQRSVQTVMRYIRPVAPFRKDPLKGVL